LKENEFDSINYAAWLFLYLILIDIIISSIPEPLASAKKIEIK